MLAQAAGGAFTLAAAGQEKMTEQARMLKPMVDGRKAVPR
jgi:hypothetical protein